LVKKFSASVYDVKKCFLCVAAARCVAVSIQKAFFVAQNEALSGFMR